MWAGQGLAFPRDLTPRHPSQWFPDKLEWGGMWPTELHPAQGLLNEILELSQICLHCGGRPVWRFASNPHKPSCTRHPRTACLPWFRPTELKALWSWVKRAQPGLAHPFLQGPDTEWRAYYQREPRIQQKVQFPFGKKGSPKTWHHHHLSFKSFQYLKGEKGWKTYSTKPLNQIKGCHTLWFTLHSLKIPLTCPVSYQSAGKWRSMAGSGDALPQVNRDQGTQRRPRSRLQQETCDLSLQQDFWLWQMATGFQGLGNSFIRPCILHCLLEDTLKTSSQYNLSHNIK